MQKKILCAQTTHYEVVVVFERECLQETIKPSQEQDCSVQWSLLKKKVDYKYPR